MSALMCWYLEKSYSVQSLGTVLEPKKKYGEFYKKGDVVKAKFCGIAYPALLVEIDVNREALIEVGKLLEEILANHPGDMLPEEIMMEMKRKDSSSGSNLTTSGYKSSAVAPIKESPVTNPSSKGKSSVKSPSNTRMSSFSSPSSNRESLVTSPSNNRMSPVTSSSSNPKSSVTSPSNNVESSVTIPSNSVESLVTSPSNNCDSSVTSPSNNRMSSVTSPFNKGKSSVTSPSNKGKSSVTSLSNKGMSAVSGPSSNRKSSVTFSPSSNEESSVTSPSTNSESSVNFIPSNDRASSGMSNSSKRKLEQKVQDLESEIRNLKTSFKSLKRKVEAMMQETPPNTDRDGPESFDQLMAKVSHLNGNNSITLSLKILASSVFTQEELISCTRTGKKTSNTGDNPKPCFSTEKLRLLERAFLTKYPELSINIFNKKFDNILKMQCRIAKKSN